MLDQISYELHQLFFGWFSTFPTVMLVCVGTVGTFIMAVWQGRWARLVAGIGAIVVTLPQAIPFVLMLISSEVHYHLHVLGWGNLRVFMWLIVASELMWWLPVALAWWLGLGIYKSRKLDSNAVSTF